MTVIVDTGVFFAFYSLRDRYHLDALGLISHMVKGKWGKAYITNHILDETINILKYRIAVETVEAFLNTFIDSGLVEVIYTDMDLELKALRILRENIERRGLSYTDAVTIAVIRELGIDYLLSFDLRSFKGLVDNIVGPSYWQTIPGSEKKQILSLARKYYTDRG